HYYPASPVVPAVEGVPYFRFSPDGRTLLFTDIGPGPDGIDTVQLVTLDLATSRRRQITHFRVPSGNTLLSGFFLDDQTIFIWQAHAGLVRYYTARTTGGRLRPLAAPVVLPGSRVVPHFVVAGGPRSQLFSIFFPGTVAEPLASEVQELFLREGRHLLQLTNFGRSDTYAAFFDRRGERVYFYGSADPVGENPSGTCNFFSADRFGGNIRQLTHFRSGLLPRSAEGCFLGLAPPDCLIGGEFPWHDEVTGSIVFDGQCNPIGNPVSSQLFAMRPDGSGLRQITSYRGMEIAPDGTVTVELPGPNAYSERRSSAP